MTTGNRRNDRSVALREEYSDMATRNLFVWWTTQSVCGEITARPPCGLFSRRRNAWTMRQLRRFWTSVVHVLFGVIVVCSICCGKIDAAVRRQHRTADLCPVRLRSNNSGATCTCSGSTINEIGCSGGLDAIPEFLPTDRVFRALYISKQNVNELIQGSFTNLQVSYLLIILTPQGQTCQLITLCHPNLIYIFNFWHSDTMALSPEHQSARMSEIKNLGYTWMALNTLKCNHLTLLHFKGLT